MAEVERVLREELAADEASVVIAKSPCVLQYKIKREPWRVDADLCNGCKRCLQAGCMALNLLDRRPIGDRGKVEIQADQCNGCGVCAQLCKFGAIQAPAAVQAADKPPTRARSGNPGGDAGPKAAGGKEAS